MTSEQLMEVNKGLGEWGLENVESIILIKNGMTNGDMIKAMFPNEHDFETDFDEDWWNAPYKRSWK